MVLSYIATGERETLHVKVVIWVKTPQTAIYSTAAWTCVILSSINTHRCPDPVFLIPRPGVESHGGDDSATENSRERNR